MKRTYMTVLLLVLSILLQAMPAVAASAGIVQTEGVIYAMDDWAQDYLSIPAAYAQSFQIQVKDAKSVSYRVVSGDSVTVSSTGLVTPNITVWYWYSGGYYSYASLEPIPGEECIDITHEVTYGTARIRVNADGAVFYVTVEVKDYAAVYADQVIDQYIREHITANMTVQQKLDAICKFPASYHYSASFSSAYGMIISGGGDCWASTDLILKVCDRLGLEAKERNGNRDSGSGSGHVNALVILGDGDYYELEAGYSGTAPRYYSVTHRTSLYSWRSVTGGIEVYQYDGYITDQTVLEIPRTIDGRTVVSLGEAFLSGTKVREVVLPETLQTIGDGAFNSCSNLVSLHIPAAVTKIGDFAFTACTALTKFTCSSNNPVFAADGNALYSKDRTTLYAAPACSQITIPDTVQTIGYYAFYCNSNLQTLYLPTSVRTLAEGVFAQCTRLKHVVVQGSPEIGAFAFADCTALQGVGFLGNSAGFDDTAFYHVTTNVCYPESNSTWTASQMQDYYGDLTWVKGHRYEQGACVFCGTVDPSKPVTGVLQGTLTTFAAGEAMLTLTVKGQISPTHTAKLRDGSYRLENLLPGTYTLTLSKADHGTRSYEVTVTAGENSLNLKLHLLGDINGDGKINVGDVSRIYAYSRGTGALDAYGQICADFTGDGRVNVGDASKLYRLTKAAA